MQYNNITKSDRLKYVDFPEGKNIDQLYISFCILNRQFAHFTVTEMAFLETQKTRTYSMPTYAPT